MHAQTGGRYFRVGLPEKRVVTTGFKRRETRRIEWQVPIGKEKWRCIPNEPRRAPWFYET